MKRKIKIDKAIYIVDDEAGTYQYSGRNTDWIKMDSNENEMNKKSINGYIRVFRSGKRKKYFRKEHP